MLPFSRLRISHADRARCSPDRESESVGDKSAGSFSEAGGGTTTVTTTETGVRSGKTYSLSDTDTSTVTSQSTTGNRLTGSQTLSETTTETSSLSNVGQLVVPPSGGGAGTAPSFTLTQTLSDTTTLTATSNLVSGGYSQSATESSSTTVHQVSRPASSAAGTLAMTADDTDTLSLTRTETGNSITGTFSRTVNVTNPGAPGLTQTGSTV